jgi:methionine synthase I (cobalamin-dependent)
MNLLDKLAKEGLIFDGGMGTMLIQEGLAGGELSESWNLKEPEIIKKIHAAYFQAGADIATTNTFAGSSFKLKKAGLEEKPEEVNSRGVEIAKEAAGAGQFVAGSIGPIGEMLQPVGMLSVEQATELFAEQAGYLAKAGADLFIIETMFDLNESQTAIKAVRSVSSLPIFATITFEKKTKGFYTIMGNTVDESMQGLAESGANVVGANCSLGSEQMIDLAAEIKKCTELPVIMQPNAGMPQTKKDQVIYPEEKEFFVDNLLKIKDLGVEVVGGCCGTNPEYIKLLAEKLKNKV